MWLFACVCNWRFIRTLDVCITSFMLVVVWWNFYVIFLARILLQTSFVYFVKYLRSVSVILICFAFWFKRSILNVECNQNVESRTKNVESKIAFGQLILRKIITTVATRCQILRQKCTKIQKSAGAPPQTPPWELTALSRPLAGFKVAYF